MNDEPFMDAIVQVVLFLELSDEETLDEDAAIRVMEQIAATLKRLQPVEKDHLLTYLGRRAEQMESGKERQCIENMADNLGLTSD